MTKKKDYIIHSK